MMDIEHWIHKLRSAGGHRGPETSEHYSYRVAGSGMGGEGGKKKGIALSSGDQVCSTSEE